MHNRVFSNQPERRQHSFSLHANKAQTTPVTISLINSWQTFSQITVLYTYYCPYTSVGVIIVLLVGVYRRLSLSSVICGLSSSVTLHGGAA